MFQRIIILLLCTILIAQESLATKRVREEDDALLNPSKRTRRESPKDTLITYLTSYATDFGAIAIDEDLIADRLQNHDEAQLQLILANYPRIRENLDLEIFSSLDCLYIADNLAHPDTQDFINLFPTIKQYDPMSFAQMALLIKDTPLPRILTSIKWIKQIGSLSVEAELPTTSNLWINTLSIIDTDQDFILRVLTDLPYGSIAISEILNLILYGNLLTTMNKVTDTVAKLTIRRLPHLDKLYGTLLRLDHFSIDRIGNYLDLICFGLYESQYTIFINTLTILPLTNIEAITLLDIETLRRLNLHMRLGELAKLYYRDIFLPLSKYETKDCISFVKKLKSITLGKMESIYTYSVMVNLLRVNPRQQAKFTRAVLRILDNSQGQVYSDSYRAFVTRMLENTVQRNWNTYTPEITQAQFQSSVKLCENQEVINAKLYTTLKADWRVFLASVSSLSSTGLNEAENWLELLPPNNENYRAGVYYIVSKLIRLGHVTPQDVLTRNIDDTLLLLEELLNNTPHSILSEDKLHPYLCKFRGLELLNVITLLPFDAKNWKEILREFSTSTAPEKLPGLTHEQIMTLFSDFILVAHKPEDRLRIWKSFTELVQQQPVGGWEFEDLREIVNILEREEDIEDLTKQYIGIFKILDLTSKQHLDVLQNHLANHKDYNFLAKTINSYVNHDTAKLVEERRIIDPTMIASMILNLIPDSSKEAFLTYLTKSVSASKSIQFFCNSYILSNMSLPDDAVYRHWQSILASDNKVQIFLLSYMLSETLYEGANPDSELARQAVQLYTLFDSDSKHSPFQDHKDLVAKREQPHTIHPDELPTYLGTRLNLELLSHLGSAHWDASQIAPISPKSISEKAEALRVSDHADSFCTENFEIKYSSILTAFMHGNYFKNLLASEPGTSLVGDKLRCIMHFFGSLDNTVQDINGVTTQDRVFLYFMLQSINCTTGKADLIDQYYASHIPEEYKVIRINSGSPDMPEEARAATAFIFDTISDLASQKLKSYSILHKVSGHPLDDPIPEAAHQTLYLLNLVANDLGVTHKLRFDIHSQVVLDGIIDAKKDQVLRAILIPDAPSDHAFTAEHVVMHVTEHLNTAIYNENPKINFEKLISLMQYLEINYTDLELWDTNDGGQYLLKNTTTHEILRRIQVLI